MIYEFKVGVGGDSDTPFQAILTVKLPPRVRVHSASEEPPPEGECEVASICYKTGRGGREQWSPVHDGPLFDALQAVLLEDHLERIFEESRDGA